MIDGQKMSKSLGNVITPLDLKKKYGSDATRALLINSAPFGYDGDISWEKMDDRYNARLANGLGNLVSRVLSLTEKYLDGKVPDINTDECAGIELLNEQNMSQGNFGKNLWDLYQNYRAKMYEVKLDESWELIVVMVGLLDKHISALKLWEFIKTDKESATRHIYALLESFRQIAWLSWPIIPETAEIIWKNLGLDPSEVMNKKIDQAMKWGLLKPGLKVERSQALFPRLK
jgi:methionyl-tRNA synthetase